MRFRVSVKEDNDDTDGRLWRGNRSGFQCWVVTIALVAALGVYVPLANADEVSGGVIGLAGGETGVTFFSGKVVELGAVAYARQADNAAHEHDLGNDFGIVTIPPGLGFRTKMTVFGGPTGVDEVQPGDLLCHYGNGVVADETFLTKGRAGVGGGSTTETFSFIGISTPGDSGSPVVECEQTPLLAFQGLGAVGLITHLWANDNEAPVTSGPVVGTTIARAIEMAQRDVGIMQELLVKKN